MDLERDVLDDYLPVFVQHLNDTRARFGQVDPSADEDGRDEGEASDADVDADADMCSLSDWTPAEQNAFFRALSVHSRWRPDLIAGCVPTKSAWEVWMYLDALEAGALALAGAARGGDGGEEEGGDKDGGMEEGWEVDVLVGGSSDLSDSCSRSSSESGADEGEDGDGDGDEDEDGDEDSNEDADGHRYVCEPAAEVSQACIDAEERMAAWIIDQERLASVEGDDVRGSEGVDVPSKRRQRGRPRHSPSRDLGHTEDLHPASTSKRKRTPEVTSGARKREALMCRLEVPHLQVLDSILRGGEEALKEAACGDEEAPEGLSLLNRTAVPQGCSSNVVIDPVLLALSGGGAPSEAGRVVAEDTSSQPAPSNMAAADAELLTPRSRRRMQKRLYMRRKRALGSGDVIDTGIEKLKPGKKKSEQSETPAPQCSEGPSDAGTGDTRKKNKSGLRLPYKLKAQFADLGVNAAYLCEQGMDLLNLGALGRLTELYSSFEDGEEETRSIDAQLIRHLQAATVAFVTEVVHRVVVGREREVRLKQRSRVWRQSDQITIGAIEHAVDVVGARYRSHKEYVGSPAASANGGVEAGCSGAHRAVYTAVVCGPGVGALGSLSEAYEREVELRKDRSVRVE